MKFLLFFGLLSLPAHASLLRPSLSAVELAEHIRGELPFRSGLVEVFDASQPRGAHVVVAVAERMGRSRTELALLLSRKLAVQMHEVTLTIAAPLKADDAREIARLGKRVSEVRANELDKILSRTGLREEGDRLARSIQSLPMVGRAPHSLHLILPQAIAGRPARATLSHLQRVGDARGESAAYRIRLGVPRSVSEDELAQFFTLVAERFRGEF